VGAGSRGAAAGWTARARGHGSRRSFVTTLRGVSVRCFRKGLHPAIRAAIVAITVRSADERIALVLVE